MQPDLEQIVQAVLAELERRQPAPAATPATEKPAAEQPTPVRSAPRELTICSRVVSLAEIGDRLNQIRRLIVAPGAIITPAVRDALDDRNIEITYAASGRPTTTTGARLVLVAARTKFDPNTLAGTLTTSGIPVETQTSECLIRTTDQLAERVRNGATLAVILTPDVAAAVCLANRLQGVRAVSAANPTDALASARAVGANILIVDPASKGQYQLKQIITQFCSTGPSPCPNPLQAKLG
jgi:hypothetical protein